MGIFSIWLGKNCSTNVTSSTAAVDFINGTGGVVIDSTYRIYKLLCSAHPVSNGDEFRIRLINGGSNVRTSGYLTEAHRSYYSGGTSRGSETNYFLRTLGGTQNTSEQRANFECTFYNMSDADHNTTGFANFCQVDGSGNTENQVNNQLVVVVMLLLKRIMVLEYIWIQETLKLGILCFMV